MKLVEAIPASKSFINMVSEYPYNVPAIDNTGIPHPFSKPQILREKRKPRRFDGNQILIQIKNSYLIRPKLP